MLGDAQSTAFHIPAALQIDGREFSGFRQGVVYSLWHCLEMIPCLCAAIRALSPETGLPGSRPPRPGSSHELAPVRDEPV